VDEVEAERIDPYACELRDLAAAVAGERTDGPSVVHHA
jgi:hypothetical protein